MSEKFCLKWTDFQSTVSQSFRILRQEEDFYDVTLVSEDELQLSAHRLVLSACSSLFKNILKKNVHTNPLIYLSGVSSNNLKNILDYVYCGEVQLFQEQVDSFLDIAKKLQISGLVPVIDNENESDQSSILKSNDQKQIPEKNVKKEAGTNSEEIKSVAKPYQNQNGRVSTSLSTGGSTEGVNEILTKEDGVFTCEACGKTGKDKGNMQRHAETHIAGVSYNCPDCKKTFRSTNSFNSHISRFHKN